MEWRERGASMTGSTVAMKFASDPSGGTIIATVAGETMTLDDIGLKFVYRRD